MKSIKQKLYESNLSADLDANSVYKKLYPKNCKHVSLKK